MSQYKTIGVGFRASDTRKTYPYDVLIDLGSDAHPIGLGEGSGHASIGSSFTLQAATTAPWHEHLHLCGCEWLIELAAEERRRGQLFTAAEIWERYQQHIGQQTTTPKKSTPASKPTVPPSDAQIIADALMAIQNADYEALESLRDRVHPAHIPALLATWDASLSWTIKDGYVALLMDQTDASVRPLMEDALHSSTVETRAYAVCILRGDFELFDRLLTSGMVDERKVDEAVREYWRTRGVGG